jgi:ketosteroid isomerase-like protein
MSFKTRTLSLVLVLSSAAFPASTEEIDATADALTQKLQAHFAEAYNRKDVTAMAGFFAENGWRITPSGVFQGRDAIRRNLQSVIEMGLHDYSVRRTISKVLTQNIIYNAGEWRAKLGDQQYQGFYSALLVRDGDEVTILEETVNVAAP